MRVTPIRPIAETARFPARRQPQEGNHRDQLQVAKGLRPVIAGTPGGNIPQGGTISPRRKAHLFYRQV